MCLLTTNCFLLILCSSAKILSKTEIKLVARTSVTESSTESSSELFDEISPFSSCASCPVFDGPQWFVPFFLSLGLYCPFVFDLFNDGSVLAFTLTFDKERFLLDLSEFAGDSGVVETEEGEP